MRIENKKLNKKLRPHTDGQAPTARINSISPSQQNFQDVLQEQNSDFRRERLESLLQNLDDLGQHLLETFSIYDLIAYKKVLQGFLEEAQQKVYGLKEETGWIRTGKPKRYQRIELLNEELKDLTQLVLEKQKDPVRLLQKLDAIRGLLVDFYS